MNKNLKTFSPTLIAALILFILLAYLFLSEMRGNKEKGTGKELFPEIEKPQISSMTLKYPGHEITLTKDGGKWVVIKDSKRFSGDDDAVGSLLSEISEMEVQKIAADNPSSLDDFGLSSPRVEVIFRMPQDEYKLLVGSDTPVGSGTYIKTDGDGKVLIADKNSLLPFLDRLENDFRDKQILALDENKINRVIFRSDDSSFEVDREDGRWVGKDMPDYVQLDQDRVRLILKAFLNLNIDNFEADNPMNLSAYGLDKPNAEIEIFEDDNSIRVLFGNKMDNGDYYIKLDSKSPVYSVSEYVFVQIPENIDEIRVRKLLDIDALRVRGLEIKDGGNYLSMSKVGDTWTVINYGKARVNEARIKDLLNEIANLEVEAFIDDNPRDLAPYGLDRPEIQITVAGPDNERVTLLFGRKEDEKVYTKISGQDSIYETSDLILSKIHVSENEFGK
ncbi:MAG: DUF4340 domain-containing protein [Thermodesulfobacteriota bacterium]